MTTYSKKTQDYINEKGSLQAAKDSIDDDIEDVELEMEDYRQLLEESTTEKDKDENEENLMLATQRRDALNDIKSEIGA